MTGIAAHARLEAELNPCCRCRLEQLRAASRELLVGRDDGLASCEQLEDLGAGRLDSAHHLRDHADRGIVAKLGELGRQTSVRIEAAVARGVAHERARRAAGGLWRARCRPRSRRATAVDGGADRSVPEEADSDLPVAGPSFAAHPGAELGTHLLEQLLDACSRSSVRCGSPASISAIHSSRNAPTGCLRATFICSRTSSSITRGPRVRSPYSAVSDTE